MPVLPLSSRRAFVLGLPACAAALSLPSLATAGSARPVSLSELVATSTAIVVGTPRRASSHWEYVGGSRRIVTVSEVEVLQVLDRRFPGDSRLKVQTLGGHVGEIGQVVHGEAAIDLHRPHVLFLRPVDAGRLRVTAFSQGHYPIQNDDAGTPRLLTSPQLAHFPKKDPWAAVERLRGQSVRDCEELIAEELYDAR